MKVLVPMLEKFSRYLSSIFFNRIKSRYYNAVYKISEVCFIFLSLVYIILMSISIVTDKYEILFGTVAIYSPLVIVMSEFIFKLREKIGADEGYAIIRKLVHSVNKEKYLINRLSLLFGKTGLGLLVFIFVILILLIGVSSFSDLPFFTYYFVLICIPIGLAGWVYITSFDQESQSVRRVVAYVVLLILAFGKSYSDFKILLDLEKHNPFSDYLLFILLTIFMAVDRLVKSVLDDINEFKKKHAN